MANSRAPLEMIRSVYCAPGSPRSNTVYLHGLFQSGVSAYFLDIILNLPLLIDRPKRYYGHLVQIVLGPTHQ